MKPFLRPLLFIIFLTTNSTLLFADGVSETSHTIINGGIGIGSALAIVICWSRTESVLTSILAGIFGWLYVIYYLIIREKEND